MAGEVIVLSARAVKSAVVSLAEEFARAYDCVVTCDFAPVGTIEQKLAGGAHADLIILSTSAITTMDKAALLVPGSTRALGRTRIGVAIRRDAAPRDISTPEAFELLLVTARSIALSDPAVGGTAARYLPQVFARMGLAELLEPKLQRCSGGGEVTERVARGDAEIGLTFISEMLPISGAKVLGPLPAPYGNETTYAAAIPRAGRSFEAAQALILALTDPRGRDTWEAAGFVQ
jgi:molybdate transport system substrate-binding protein